MSDWAVDNDNEQIVDSGGNRLYSSEFLPDKSPPPIVSQSHYHGLQRKKISNEYRELIDHDACVASEFPTTNYGNNQVLGVLEKTGPHYVYVYIKATGLSNFSSGHTLDQGFLNLKRIWLGGAAEHISKIEVRRISGADWDESIITWNTKPAEGAEFFEVELRDIAVNTWQSFELKTWLQNWIDGVWNNYGLVLKPIYDDPIKRFASSENSVIEERPFFSLFYFPYD